MPQRLTMLVAIWVAFSKSFAAPGVTSWKSSSSAARPPISAMSRARRSDSDGQVVVLLRADGHSEGFAVGEERDLLDLARVAVDLAADGVAHLVGGDDRPVALVHRAAPARADRDLQPAGVHVLVGDRRRRSCRAAMIAASLSRSASCAPREAVRLAREPGRGRRRLRAACRGHGRRGSRAGRRRRAGRRGPCAKSGPVAAAPHPARRAGSWRR